MTGLPTFRALLRIHLLAAWPSRPWSIALGIGLSLAPISAAVREAGVSVEEAWPGYRQALELQSLFAADQWLAVAVIFAWMVVVWSILGGAVTRQMTLAILDRPGESWLASLRFCCRPVLGLPAALASACFFLLLMGARYPVLFLPLLPMWLYAGFLYGALTEERIGLRTALERAHARMRPLKRLVALQARFLVGFALSTGVVYLLAASYLALAWHLAGPSWLILGPVASFAVGYTTANLKSLQIYLYSQMAPG